MEAGRKRRFCGKPERSRTDILNGFKARHVIKFTTASTCVQYSNNENKGQNLNGILLKM